MKQMKRKKKKFFYPNKNQVSTGVLESVLKKCKSLEIKGVKIKKVVI